MSIKVDKAKLKQFFQGPTNKIPKDLLDEVDKVFSIIISKYYSKYYYMAEELKSLAMLAILERRDRFDDSRDAYNYIFTVFRNEVGNKIKSLTREVSSDDGSDELHNVSVVKTLTSLVQDKATIPEEIEKYGDYLSGEKPFTMIRVSKKELLPLMLYIKAHEPTRYAVPDFVYRIEGSTKVLYTLLKEIIDSNYE